ncbi:hypothetical protein [Phascolarctobacterium succinatutens]
MQRSCGERRGNALCEARRAEGFCRAYRSAA